MPPYLFLSDGHQTVKRRICSYVQFTLSPSRFLHFTLSHYSATAFVDMVLRPRFRK